MRGMGGVVDEGSIEVDDVNSIFFFFSWSLTVQREAAAGQFNCHDMHWHFRISQDNTQFQIGREQAQ